MPQVQACLFSPFSPHSVRQEQHRTLLLQFFLKELLAAHQAILHEAPINLVISSEKRHFPYDWAHESGHVNKAREHAQLFIIAFENFEEQVEQIHMTLADLVLTFSGRESLNSRQKLQIKRKLHQLYQLAEPLVSLFKSNENLIFFLLKNQDPVNALMGKGYLRTYLSHLHKKGLGQLEKKLCDHFHDRGFSSLIPELKKRFSELSRSN